MKPFPQHFGAFWGLLYSQLTFRYCLNYDRHCLKHFQLIYPHNVGNTTINLYHLGMVNKTTTKNRDDLGMVYSIGFFTLIIIINHNYEAFSIIMNQNPLLSLSSPLSSQYIVPFLRIINHYFPEFTIMKYYNYKPPFPMFNPCHVTISHSPHGSSPSKLPAEVVPLVRAEGRLRWHHRCLPWRLCGGRVKLLRTPWILGMFFFPMFWDIYIYIYILK